MSNRLFPCLALAASIASATPCVAQTFSSQSRPTVPRAAELIVAPPTTIDVDTDFEFRRLDTADARRIKAAGFQIRIFTLDSAGAQPREFTTIDGCNLYISTLIHVPAGADASITVGRIDASWLDITNSGDNIKPGNYFFVFEQAGADSQVFRLRATDAPVYFAQGFGLSVKAAGTTTLEQVRERLAARQAKLVTLTADVGRTGPGVPCYRYKALVATEAHASDTMTAQLERCTEQVSAPTSVQ